MKSFKEKVRSMKASKIVQAMVDGLKKEWVQINLEQLAFKEALMIKDSATKEEKNKLNIHLLDPDSKEQCIYGLLTGHCNSERAIQLLNKYASPLTGAMYMSVDGGHKRNILISHRSNYNSMYSPLEDYILMTNAKISDLILLIKS